MSNQQDTITGVTRVLDRSKSIYTALLDKWYKKTIGELESENDFERLSYYNNLDITKIHAEPPTVIDESTVTVCLVSRETGKMFPDRVMDKVTLDEILEYPYTKKDTSLSKNTVYQALLKGINGNNILPILGDLSDNPLYYLIKKDGKFFIFLDGPDGTSFALSSLFETVLKGLDFEEVKSTLIDETDTQFPSQITDETTPEELTMGTVLIKDRLLSGGSVSLSFISLPKLKTIRENQPKDIAEIRTQYRYTVNPGDDVVISLTMTPKEGGEIGLDQFKNIKLGDEINKYPGTVSNLVKQEDGTCTLDMTFKNVPATFILNGYSTVIYDLFFDYKYDSYTSSPQIDWNFTSQITVYPTKAVLVDGLNSVDLTLSGVYNGRKILFSKTIRDFDYTDVFSGDDTITISNKKPGWFKSLSEDGKELTINVSVTGYGTFNYSYTDSRVKDYSMSIADPNETYSFVNVSADNKVLSSNKQISFSSTLSVKDKTLKLKEITQKNITLKVGDKVYNNGGTGYTQNTSDISISNSFYYGDSDNIFGQSATLAGTLLLGLNSVELSYSMDVTVPNS